MDDEAEEADRSDTDDLFRTRLENIIDAILAGVGQNVRLVLRWFQRLLLCLVLRWLYDVFSRQRTRPA